MGRSRGRTQRRPYAVPDGLSVEERAWMREQMALAGATEKAVHPAMRQIAQASSAQARGRAVEPATGYSLADVINALTPGGPRGFIAAMPRDRRDSAPFGPLSALTPDALDDPRPDTGRPGPRLTEYPIAWNVPTGDHRLISWKTLREAARNIDVITACIDIRKKALRSMKWAWSVTDEAIAEAYAKDPRRGKADVAAKLREDWAADIKRLTDFWAKPWRSQGLDFGQWVNGVMDDYLTLDAVTIYPRTTYGGDLLAFEILDSATIKPLIDWRGARPEPPFPAFQQILYGFPRGEWTATVDATTSDGQPIVSSGFMADQLYYFRENYRTWTPYGWSAVERALMSARLYLKRQGWMLDEYDAGSVPEMYLELNEATPITPQERVEWEDSLNDDLSGQSAARHRAKVLYPGMTPHLIDMVDERYKPDYDLFLIKLMTMHLGINMDQLGFTESRGLGASGVHQAQQRASQDQGEDPDASLIASMVNDLAATYQNRPPALKFQLLDPKNDDEAERAGIIKERITVGLETINEGRQDQGLAALDMPEADMPFILTGTGPVFLEGSSVPKTPLGPDGQPLPPGTPPAGGAPAANAAADQGADDDESDDPADDAAKLAEADQWYAAKAAEATAYKRWAKRNPNPARPFKFEHHSPDEIEALTGNLDKVAAMPETTKVGPKGYEHGWIFVGIPLAGSQVFHPRHGTGLVTRHEFNAEGSVTRAHVQFGGNKTHSFEIQDVAGREPGFRQRHAQVAMHISQVRIGDQVKQADEKYHTVRGTGWSKEGDGPKKYELTFEDGGKWQAADGQYAVRTERPEYMPLHGEDAERMKRWKADARKQGRIAHTKTERQHQIEYQTEERDKAKAAMEAERERGLAEAKRKRVRVSERQAYIDRNTQAFSHQMEMEGRERELERLKDPSYTQNRDKISAEAAARFDEPVVVGHERVQPVNPDRPLAVYGNMLTIHDEDARTHQHLADLERVPAHTHAFVADDLAASNKAEAGIYAGSRSTPDLDDLKGLRNENPSTSRNDGADSRTSYDEVGGVYMHDRRVAIGYTGDWGMDTVHRHSTATHELGHALDYALGRHHGNTSYGGASSEPEFQALHQRMITTGGDRLQPYFKRSHEAWAEGFSQWHAAAEPTGKQMRLQKEFGIDAQTARDLGAYYQRLDAQLKDMAEQGGK